MNCLFLDIASHEGCIAIVKDGAVSTFENFDHPLRDHELIPTVEKYVEYEDLTHAACVIGPGGFTSLRIAVSFVNTLMHELNIPVCGIHLADLYHARVETPRRGVSTVWLHATKRDQMFVRLHNQSDLVETPCHGVSTDIELLSVNDVLNTVPKGSMWCGELLDEQKQALSQLVLQEAVLQPIEQVLPEFIEKQHFEAKILTPWYGRE